MKVEPPTVELLVNPFCMAQRDVATIGGICDTRGVRMTVYDLWEIDDAQLGNLPPHISELIREWRSGLRPGSVYSSVFVNGKRIPLNSWPDHQNKVTEAITEAQGEVVA